MRYFIFSSFILISSCATLEHSQRGALPGEVHVVEKGDTLWSISREYHVSVEDLKDVNGIGSSDSLRVGQILFVPDSTGAHKVQIAELPKKEEAPKTIDTDERKIILSWPVEKGVVFRSFNTNPAKLYEGIAIGAPQNTPVKAAADGEVIYVGNNGPSYGEIVLIKHDEPFITIYAHVDQIRVKKGQKVKKGEVIAAVGTTGEVESPRVQFQVRKNRTAVNPEQYLPTQG